MKANAGKTEPLLYPSPLIEAIQPDGQGANQGLLAIGRRVVNCQSAHGSIAFPDVDPELIAKVARINLARTVENLARHPCQVGGATLLEQIDQLFHYFSRAITSYMGPPATFSR